MNKEKKCRYSNDCSLPGSRSELPEVQEMTEYKDSERKENYRDKYRCVKDYRVSLLPIVNVSLQDNVPSVQEEALKSERNEKSQKEPLEDKIGAAVDDERKAEKSAENEHTHCRRTEHGEKDVPQVHHESGGVVEIYKNRRKQQQSKAQRRTEYGYGGKLPVEYSFLRCFRLFHLMHRLIREWAAPPSCRSLLRRL